jgi:hypothetical protein
MANSRPIQFSIRALLCLTVGIGSVLAACLPHGEFAPVVGWVILALIYYFQGWKDLLFVHGILPGISLLILAILAAAGLTLAPPGGGFWADTPELGYLLLFVSCLAGNLVSQMYDVYLLFVVGVTAKDE